MNCLKVEWQIIENDEAGSKETAHKTTINSNGDAYRGGKQQKAQGPVVTVASQITARVPVDGSHHCEGPHLKKYSPSNERGQSQNGGGGQAQPWTGTPVVPKGGAVARRVDQIRTQRWPVFWHSLPAGLTQRYH